MNMTEIMADLSSHTPMMQQYLRVKMEHPHSLMFYRMGDFFELFFDDAKAAAEVLDIALTSRGEHDGAPVPMCGVPVERSEDYLHRLIGAGHRVAVCEQTENPAEAKARGNKSVVRRGVVRLVTPGTLTEDTLLDARTAWPVLPPWPAAKRAPPEPIARIASYCSRCSGSLSTE